MTARERLLAARQVFLDTAPVIYFVEAHPHYLDIVDLVFRRLDEGSLLAIISPVTLAECLVHPLRQGNSALATAFAELLTRGMSTQLVSIDEDCGRKAAEIRATYGLTLTDALQLSVAFTTGCEAFLTNDAALKRYPLLDVVTLDDLLAISK